MDPAQPHRGRHPPTSPTHGKEGDRSTSGWGPKGAKGCSVSNSSSAGKKSSSLSCLHGLRHGDGDHDFPRPFRVRIASPGNLGTAIHQVTVDRPSSPRGFGLKDQDRPRTTVGSMWPCRCPRQRSASLENHDKKMATHGGRPVWQFTQASTNSSRRKQRAWWRS